MLLPGLCIFASVWWHCGFNVAAIRYPQLLKQRGPSEIEGYVIRLDANTVMFTYTWFVPSTSFACNAALLKVVVRRLRQKMLAQALVLSKLVPALRSCEFFDACGIRTSQPGQVYVDHCGLRVSGSSVPGSSLVEPLLRGRAVVTCYTSDLSSRF